MFPETPKGRGGVSTFRDSLHHYPDTSHTISSCSSGLLLLLLLLFWTPTRDAVVVLEEWKPWVCICTDNSYPKQIVIVVNSCGVHVEKMASRAMRRAGKCFDMWVGYVLYVCCIVCCIVCYHCCVLYCVLSLLCCIVCCHCCVLSLLCVVCCVLCVCYHCCVVLCVITAVCCHCCVLCVCCHCCVLSLLCVCVVCFWLVLLLCWGRRKT